MPIPMQDVGEALEMDPNALSSILGKALQVGSRPEAQSPRLQGDSLHLDSVH